MVTSRDVARVAGVSQATVSRVMSSYPGLAPATRAKVLEAMETLGYVPHAGAQAMKTRRSNVIGVVVADLTNPFYSEILDELTKELDTAGMRVVVWNAGGGSHHDALKAIRERAVDGVVFTTATEESVELEAAVQQRSPIVLINRVVDGLDCDKVTSSNHSGGAAVAEYLVAHGRTRVAFIGADDQASTSRDRAKGFLARMRELGHPVHSRNQFHGDFSHEFSATTMGTLLARKNKPDAVFCANDYLAFGALDTLKTANRTSSECWVIGYDDIEMASWSLFDLTTVRQPSREMARVGAQLLLQRISTPDAPFRTVEFPCELVIRGSTRD
ncbi:LacI family DNA-binding transcriptional regulator [Rhodococcus wratislaviensis]|uniref:LacI family DNA-binding transcriptional regulator n=1 Tax=Rhodococcus wratislaviensis TaxID=44752 RepID=UPI00365FE529